MKLESPIKSPYKKYWSVRLGKHCWEFIFSISFFKCYKTLFSSCYLQLIVTFTVWVVRLSIEMMMIVEKSDGANHDNCDTDCLFVKENVNLNHSKKLLMRVNLQPIKHRVWLQKLWLRHYPFCFEFMNLGSCPINSTINANVTLLNVTVFYWATN